ncbi:hypothetical protein LTR84_005240 [Exophiala bonariae]|uniref:HbrB-like protein n=1 Tax=Exophiala bonariae TaxID=1690606 RepID=A0AAV9NRW4_9EURO|nr:hypothetical protein LTR84_005240 [Exophiala bonariae]
MEPPAQRRGGLRSPVPSSSAASVSPNPSRAGSKQSMRPGSSGSDTSASSNLSVVKRSPYNQQLPTFSSHTNHSNAATAGHQRPSAPYMPRDDHGKPLGGPPPPELQKHRPRQHSQGYFEPSMPSASLASQSNLHDHATMSGLTPSQIAAQAAMQHLNATNHNRKRSQTVPFPQEQTQQEGRRSSRGSTGSHEGLTPSHPAPDQQYRNGLIGNNAAATAASVVFPRGVTPSAQVVSVEEEKSKKGLKRFRPKHMVLSRDKDKDIKDKPLPSPNRLAPSGLSKVLNASTSSLTESLSSNNSSLYQLQNPSSSTIIPIPEAKDKPHKHHGLRQKLKLKDKDESYTLPLSSANSNSRPVDINNPQSLYSFAPSSPNPTSSFSKSVSGLDLRHGGRALREKKKEEKEKAQALAGLEPVYSRGETDTSEWPSLGTSFTNQSLTNFNPHAEVKDASANFGLNNMSADDAWDLLRAKILVAFEGEEVRIAVENLNKLVTIHVQRCVQKRDPSIIIGDLEDLLRTGFLSLNHTLRMISDDRLVPHLVSMWMQVFGTVLPFMQAVFLPLDQEFKGRGSILTSPKMAGEFWGALPSADSGSKLSSSPAAGDGVDFVVAAGEELEVRRILLIAYRDVIILPRFEHLKATFSRLSLESINVALSSFESANRHRGNSGASDRPGTATGLEPMYASYNSQTSTLLGSSTSGGGRSRATSNLSISSNPAQDVAFQSFSSPPAARPSDSSSAQVTETVARMLQCLSVLCSVQSGDDAQAKMEELSRQLKLNWLGRGRTGRNRKGFVGSRVRPAASVGSTIRGLNRDGSPTPTPTRQGTVSRQGDDSSRF